MLNDELLARIESYIAAHHVKLGHVYASIDIDALEKELQLIKETFPQYLLNFIAERGLNEVDVYKRARLSRQIFSKLRTQKGYMPRKRTIIAIAFAMELTLDEAAALKASEQQARPAVRYFSRPPAPIRNACAFLASCFKIGRQAEKEPSLAKSY